MSKSLFSKTPAVMVFDNQGLGVRDIAYHRHPDSPDKTDERITRHQYDTRGFLTQSADPRLHEAGLANITSLTDMAGNLLYSQGVDNGTTLALNDAAGRPFMAVNNLRSPEAVTRTWQYEDVTLPGRPLSATENTLITERFVYAGNTDAEKALNLAGVCVRHYDTAGLVQTDSIALTGVPLSLTRRLLQDADNPDTVADWQGQDASAWNDVLAAETFTTLTTVDATGAVLTTTDAKGNLQRLAYDVAGLLSGSWLTLKGGKEQVILASLTYSPAGQKLREVHGNGVVTTWTYEPETQRLTGIKTKRPAGHASGAKVLQDLRYQYDPVGNVLSIRNDAEETRFWRNQKVVPENTYVYDSLYQLVSATGREMANIGQQSSNAPSASIPIPTDSTAYTSYTRTYLYDNAGNLTQIRHSAPATSNSYTTDITVSDRSNRGVLSTLTQKPAEVDALFTAGGQQTRLQPGQTLAWTARNELLKVTPVVRDGGADDRESYRYDGGSQRCLKISTQKTANSTQTQRVLYLPALELRTATSGEDLQVITVGEAGRAQVRVLHWAGGLPAGISNDQVRYSHDNLIGSSSLELDAEGKIISQEEYYPYGGTAVWAARSLVEAGYKILRYSGKERDATGMYYYDYRYYQPWVGRWLSADPAGAVDGLNMFRMVRNNPLTLRDRDGLMPVDDYAAFINRTRPSASTSTAITGIDAYTQYLIKEKTPGYQGKKFEIMDSFSLAEEVLDEAITVLNTPDKNTHEMQDLFAKMNIDRTEYTEVAGQFLNIRFNEMKRIIGLINKEPNSKMVFKMDEKPKEFALVSSGDTEYKINLTSIFVNKLKLFGKIDTVLHEVSHFNMDDIIGTLDSYYLNEPENEPDDIDEYLSLRMDSAKHLSSAIKQNTAPLANIITKGVDIDFKYANLTELALGNADHVAAMAMYLGRSKLQ